MPNIVLPTPVEFKALRARVSYEVRTDLYQLLSSDPEAAKQRMVELDAGQGMTLTTEKLRGFRGRIDEASGFDKAAAPGRGDGLGSAKRKPREAIGSLPWDVSNATPPRENNVRSPNQRVETETGASRIIDCIPRQNCYKQSIESLSEWPSIPHSWSPGISLNISG